MLDQSESKFFLQLEGVCNCRRGVRPWKAWFFRQNKDSLVNLFTFWHPALLSLLPWKGMWNQSTKRTLKAAGFTPCSKFQLVCGWELNPRAACALEPSDLEVSLVLWGIGGVGPNGAQWGPVGPSGAQWGPVGCHGERLPAQRLVLENEWRLGAGLAKRAAGLPV